MHALKNRESLSVREVMDTQVFYIREDQSLDKALGACIKKRRSLLVVVNQYRETVGVITVEDIIEQLIGRKIIDQFDEYDDLRAVAETNPRKNNLPKRGEDIA
jgi:CBS domain containing-hemolysin-like protein